ncbi:MAG: Cyclic di-GMP phosphodiesterase response regulator RpfG [Chroococcopsis gigantea SAG 12.99]|jgi:putative two-component system response regulator|nr:Cyclic di-GMP phosphodiesterase response regulator RpfG [Chroococcopsis gigantea SAG 12.99]
MPTLINLERARVLVVDNHPHSRMAARDLLALEGYDVIEADESLNLQDAITSVRPDLILLDVMQPYMTGFEVCLGLKKDAKTKMIPIILTTVGDESSLRQRCNQVGGDDLLLKPLKRLELSNRVKSLIDQKRLSEGLDQIEQVLFAIARAIENRYPDNGSNCTRLAALAQSFGQYLQLSTGDIQNLRCAAYLHDIGTIGIPDEILLKEGELTKEERAIVQRHVLIGVEICQPLPNGSGVLPIIRHHHERWDGSGYPDGLIGTEIPWLAQVFQILDIYVALTSKRPHKETYQSQQAMEILELEKERRWRNPVLVDQFKWFLRRIDSN